MAELSGTVATVGIIDDHPLFRMGLRVVLEHARFCVAFDTSSAREAIERIQGERVDVAIVDPPPDATNGMELIRAIQHVQGGMRILSLSVLDDPMRIAAILRAGATGYAHKRATPEVVLEALRRVVDGERYLPPDSPQLAIERLASGLEPWPLDGLTSREREVFGLLVEGCSNDDIATRLFIARRTVETHRHHVMHKLAARSLVDLVRIALRCGITVR